MATNVESRRNWQDLPDADGRFGQYGGRFVTEAGKPLRQDLQIG